MLLFLYSIFRSSTTSGVKKVTKESVPFNKEPKPPQSPQIRSRYQDQATKQHAVQNTHNSSKQQSKITPKPTSTVRSQQVSVVSFLFLKQLSGSLYSCCRCSFFNQINSKLGKSIQNINNNNNNNNHENFKIPELIQKRPHSTINITYRKWVRFVFASWIENERWFLRLRKPKGTWIF